MLLCFAEYLTHRWGASRVVGAMTNGNAQARAAASNTVALESHALGTLQYIRASIDAAGLLAVPGSAGMVMGCVGLAAAALVSRPQFAPHWFAVWLAAGILAVVCGSGLILHQAGTRRTALYRGPARKFMLCLCPALVAGAVLTSVLWLHGSTALIPGTWLLLYGCGVTAAGTMTVRPVAIMGGLFLLLGIAALLLPPASANLLLGAGFGGLHVIFGALIRWTTHEH